MPATRSSHTSTLHMKELHLFYAPELPIDTRLPDDEAAHALRVLRMKEGDPLVATDGRGAFYHCTIASTAARRCTLNIEQVTHDERGWQGHICIGVAPTKNMDRMEWLAEKATEIGFDRLTLLDCRFSERRVVKTERLERIVVAATKQSHKAWKPCIDDMTSFDAFIAQPFQGQKFIAHCYDMPDLSADAPAATCTTPHLATLVCPTGDALVLIGPEGDFSTDEVRAAIAAGFVPISLGRSRLRTETAALAAVHIINLAKSISLSLSCKNS